MKISEIINELTELKEYIGDKDLDACIANDTTAGVNVMYENDNGGITSTSLEGEKMARQMKATMNDPDILAEFNVKILHLDFCDGSDDPELVAMADVEVTSDHDPRFLVINGLGLRYNDTTREYSIVVPKSPSGVCINELTQRAVTSAVASRYEQIKHSDSGKTIDVQAATNTIISNSAESNSPPKPVAFFDHRKEPDCTMEYQVYDKQEADAYIHWLEQKAGVLHKLYINRGKIMNYLAENTFLTKENYEERLKEIKSWFDKEDKIGEYDELSSIEELKLQCEAKDAYIRHLEAPVRSTNTQYIVEYIGVKDDRKFYKYGYYNTEAEALAVFDVLCEENPYISYMKVFDLNNKILKEMECEKEI